jgi:hypothetical protein
MNTIDSIILVLFATIFMLVDSIQKHPVLASLWIFLVLTTLALLVT